MNPFAVKNGKNDDYTPDDNPQPRPSRRDRRSRTMNYGASTAKAKTAPSPAPVSETKAVKKPEVRANEKTPTQLVADKLNRESGEPDIVKFMRKQLRLKKIDTVERRRVTDAMVKATGLGKREIGKIWQQAEKLEAEYHAKRDPLAGAKPPLVNEADFHTMIAYGRNRIDAANKAEPRCFHYMDQLAVIRDRATKKGARIKWLNEGSFANFLNTVAVFQKAVGDGGARQGVPAPRELISHLYHDDYDSYPALRGLVTSPMYTAKGKLVASNGYHKESQLYMKLHDQLAVKTVSDAPTEDEVLRAKTMLVEEVFADFPLGGLTRSELVEQALYGDGVAAMTNLIGLTLLPFMREMVDGPTPGHLLTKPAPGTGASLLTDVVSIITTGSTSPAMAMPGNKDEMGKTLTSVLANGNTIVFFDNISHAVDSGELASAMTTPVYAARILGKSQTVETEVRCVWILTGNNVKLSHELVRRLLMIDLNAKVKNPELRTDFKHQDIRGWATENRGELVWACLTLIQNWIARGQKRDTTTVLASFENWSTVMGGVLKAAGIGNFMGNGDQLKAAATTAKRTGENDFIEALCTEFGHGSVFRPRGVGKFRKPGQKDADAVAATNLLEWVNKHNAAHADDASETDQIRLSGGGYDDRYDPGENITVARYAGADGLRAAIEKHVLGNFFEIAAPVEFDQDGKELPRKRLTVEFVQHEDTKSKGQAVAYVLEIRDAVGNPIGLDGKPIKECGKAIEQNVG